MCVIVGTESKIRPTPEAVAKMFYQNDHGGGIAWREAHAGVTYVHWKKWLNEEEMQDMCANVPLPFVAHFRIASIGGRWPELCHPFPIDLEMSNALEGRTQSHVLFHNGHWGVWKERCQDLAYKTGRKLPIGKWNDSRGMAFLAGSLGLGILEWIDEKALAFGPERCEAFGNPWFLVDGVWVSNKGWENARPSKGNVKEEKKSDLPIRNVYTETPPMVKTDHLLLPRHDDTPDDVARAMGLPKDATFPYRGKSGVYSKDAQGHIQFKGYAPGETAEGKAGGTSQVGPFRLHEVGGCGDSSQDPCGQGQPSTPLDEQVQEGEELVRASGEVEEGDNEGHAFEMFGGEGEVSISCISSHYPLMDREDIEELTAQVNWAIKLNPKDVRRSALRRLKSQVDGKHLVDPRLETLDDSDRKKRSADLKKGIERVGPM